jgi:hypothetical protein
MLCLIQSISSHPGNEQTPSVLVFEFLGGDRWACTPNARVRCRDDWLPAGELRPNDRIWLPISTLIADGTFYINSNEEELN